MEELLHVIVLNPEQQLAARLMVYNYTKLHIKSVVFSLLDNPTEEAAHTKWDRISNLLEYADNLTASFPTFSTIDKWRPKLLMFNTKSLDFVTKSIEAYDSVRNANLERDEIELIEHCIESIRDLLSRSRNFVYTDVEIKKALGK